MNIMGRRHHGWLRMPVLLAAGLVAGLTTAGCDKEETLFQRPGNEPQIKAFFTAKEAQARQLASMENKDLPPEIWPYFEAGKNGDWATVTNLYAKMARRSYQFDGNKENDERLHTMAWQTINETDRFYLQCTQADSKHARAFGEEIMRVVPPGSIYFGDTDTGRFVPTALCRDHAKGDLFYVLTQNAMADGLYLAYLRAMFGSRLNLPTLQDSQNAFAEYIADAKERLKKGALPPGEDVQVMGNRVAVRGQLAIVKINGLMSKRLFDRNPGKEFYVCEGFPTEWMYPHSEPHGPILKLNRRKLAELTGEVIARDEAYWNQRIIPFLGDWLKPETTVAEICDFVEKVYVRQDFKGFSGDTNFTRMATFWRKVPAYQSAAATWSKARSAIAGVYVWRINDSATQIKAIQELSPEELKKREPDLQRLAAEQQRYIAAADFAYRQSFALNPSSPEALYRYVALLTSMGGHDEAWQLIGVSKKLAPEVTAALEGNLPPPQRAALPK